MPWSRTELTLSKRLVDHCNASGWWYDDASHKYQDALATAGIVSESDARQFFVHVEDGPEFLTGRGRLYQLAWHLLNTDLPRTSAALNEALGLPSSFITFDGFEGGSGYFYDRESRGVVLKRLGQDDCPVRWEDFSSFLEYFFGVDGSTP